MKTKVKFHTKKTKKGLIIVKEHDRTNSSTKLQDFFDNEKKQTIDFYKQHKNQKVNESILAAHKQAQKQRTIDFTTKAFKLNTEHQKHKSVVDKIQIKLNKVNDKLFKPENIIKNNNGRIKGIKTIKPNKSKSTYKGFGYFGNGEAIDSMIKNEYSIKTNDRFYNQQIVEDKNWGETLKRKDLKIIMVNGDDKFSILHIDNGKMKTTNINGTKKDIFKIIKRGLN
jgi:hypothetical protein